MLNRSAMLIHGIAAWIVIIGAVAVGDETQPRFKITTKRDNDEIKIVIDKDKTIFSVTSPFGISGATVERIEEKWPDRVVVRMHLKGLEGFEISNGKAVVHAAFSEAGEESVSRQWMNEKEEAPLNSKSSHWLEIKRADSDAPSPSTKSPKGAKIEVQLPKALFEDNPKSIRLKWIDYYRN